MIMLAGAMLDLLVFSRVSWEALTSPGRQSDASVTAPPVISHGRWLRVLLLAGLALLPFAVYPQFLSDDAFLYGFDSGQSHYARYRVLGDAIQEHREFPLWQTLSYGGSPFHANPENPTLYPLALGLSAFLPPLLVMNLMILGHLALAGVGMALLVSRLARRINLPGAGGLAGPVVAGLLFGANRWMRIEHFNLVAYGAAHALIPWILLCVEGVLHGAVPRRWAAAGALLLAAQVFTGGLYVIVYSCLGLVLWVLGEGILGGARARRRALAWGTLMAGLAGLVALAKLLPYLSWVEITNRADSFDLELFRGVTLLGQGSVDWSSAWTRLRVSTGGGAGLLGLLVGLCVIRRPAVRTAAVLVALGLFVAAGPGYDLLYTWVPPFSKVRGAIRGWTLVNAFLPIVAGLGVTRALAALPRPFSPRVRDLGAIALLTALLLPGLLETNRHQAVLDQPDSLQARLGLYPNWTNMAEQAGDAWRVMCLNVRRMGTRNEQFISAALGVPTPSGFFGFAYPTAVARHLYNNEPPIKSIATRKKRALSMSVRYAVLNAEANLHDISWKKRDLVPFPGGVDGPQRWEAQAPRPPALLPARVGAVLGDVDEEVLYRIYDAPAYAPSRSALLCLSADALPEAEAQAGLSELVVVAGAQQDPRVAAWLAQAREAGISVTNVALPLTAQGLKQLRAVAKRLSSKWSRAGTAQLLRTSPGHATVKAGSLGPAGRWLVLTETWALYGGWVVQAAGRRVPLVRCDGVGTAMFLKPNERWVDARYDPVDVRRGALLGAAGLVIGLALLLAPRRRSEPAASAT